MKDVNSFRALALRAFIWDVLDGCSYLNMLEQSHLFSIVSDVVVIMEDFRVVLFFFISFSNTSPPFHYLCEDIRVCMLLYGYCPYDEDALFYGMVVDSKHVFYFFLISK